VRLIVWRTLVIVQVKVAAMAAKQPNIEGLHHYQGHLGSDAQRRLIAAIDAVIAESPLYVPTMPKSGRPLSVRMTNCGKLGWVTCKERGYRYQEEHPETGRPWPDIPDVIMRIWKDCAGITAEPEACLVNWYEPGAKLGLHVDRDEAEFAAPVVSISLGDDAWFRVGGPARRDPTSRLRLKSGDVIVLGGPARLIHHGIDRIVPGSGDLLARPGRYNLTLRRVAPIAS
jgi:alkylated DNA repair protein (DNA oxidative demethylase)